MGLEPNDVITLGNDHNDSSMLDWSGHPRVVANAPPELLARYKSVPPAGEGGFAAAAAEAWELFALRTP
jgi:hydroxymethylpyrimidine pyrophosphatase-like HAD family hydrolase